MPMSEINWMYPDPFTIDVRVRPEDIDVLNHTNNAVYIKWCEQISWAHSEHLGLDLAAYQRLNRAMVIHRIEMEYLRPAHLGDAIRIGTWIVHSDGRLRLRRRFQVVRITDQVTLLQGETLFVCADLTTGKPARMPREFVEGYGAVFV